MSIIKRYGALLLFVAIYQTLFFIPLLSAPYVESTADSGVLSALVFGVSPYVFHYQSLGLLPFVFGSLFVTFVGVAYKPWRELDKQGSAGAKKKQSISGKLTYLFGFVMSLSIASATGYVFVERNFWFVVIELMFALQTLKFIFDKVQSLKVASSGLTVFFGLNILTLFIKDLSVTSSMQFTNHFMLMLFATVCLSVVTVYLTYRFIFGKTGLALEVNKSAQGTVVSVPLVVQYSQSGIMPVIFSIMITSLISAFAFTNVSDADPIFSSAGGVLVFLVTLFLMTFYFTHQKISPTDLVKYFSKEGVSVSGVKPSDSIVALRSALQKLRNKVVAFQVLFLFFMMFAQSVWISWTTANSFPALSFVAGINWFLLMTVYADMSKQYDKLRISS
jgi:preprotein translocase subunit SecY